jgi:hypothetical protein
VKQLLAVLIAFCPAIALAWPLPLAPAAQTPHPAVVRVIAAETDGASLGTGALVAVDEAHGLVVTNWHVVRDATGPITVVFPNGFRSGALLLKTDRDWDLAALAIQRPQVQPLLLAAEAPRPGEPLSIAGYGPEGAYRAVAGRCVKYHTPGRNLPYEIVEVDVEARRGDSGGPICNSRGEIAGVLFGAAGNMWAGGYTMGSYCGRVRQFLAAAYVDFQRLPGNTAMVAQAPAPQPPPITATGAAPSPSVENPLPSFTSPPRQVLSETPSFPSERAGSNSSLRPIAEAGPLETPPAPGGKIPVNRPNPPALGPPPSNSPVAQVSPAAVIPQTEPLPSRVDQIKTVLAVIGIIAILFHGLRLVGSSVG